MGISHHAFPLTGGHAEAVLKGLELPDATHAVALAAQGVLERTVYVALDGSGSARAAVLGYHRPHTAQQKLTAFAGSELLRAGLLAFAAREAERTGARVRFDESADDGRHTHRAAAGHYRQTTEFTCGPVALLTAHRHLGHIDAITRAQELEIWREATMVLACDPYGLALASARRGIAPEVWVSREGPVLDPHGGIGIIDPALAQEAQLDFERQVRQAGLTVRVGAFGAKEVRGLLEQGRVAIILIDEVHWHGTVCPHWICVTGCEGELFTIEDPWTDAEFGETSVDAHALLVTSDDLDLIASYQGAQAMLVL